MSALKVAFTTGIGSRDTTSVADIDTAMAGSVAERTQRLRHGQLR